MFTYERLGLIVLGIGLVIFLILLSMRSCGAKETISPTVEAVNDSVSASTRDTILIKPKTKTKGKKKQKAPVLPYQRSHLDENT